MKINETSFTTYQWNTTQIWKHKLFTNPSRNNLCCVDINNLLIRPRHPMVLNTWFFLEAKCVELYFNMEVYESYFEVLFCSSLNFNSRFNILIYLFSSFLFTKDLIWRSNNWKQKFNTCIYQVLFLQRCINENNTPHLKHPILINSWLCFTYILLEYYLRGSRPFS